VSGKQSWGRDGDINRRLNRGRKNAAKVIKFSRPWTAKTRNNQLPTQPSGADCIQARYTASVAARNRAMRATIIIAGLFISAGTANAIKCQSSPPPSNRGHWAWRLIDDKKCWYAGEPGMDKSKSHWAANTDRTPEPTQRSTPEPAERTTLQPAPRTEPVMPPSAEAQPWSTFGIGLAVPASDSDWAGRWPSDNVTPSAISIATGSDGVATESHTQSRDHAPASGAALIGILIFVLATLYTLATWAFCSGKRLPPSRFRRIAHRPPVGSDIASP
jgi:hypothetical protein